jgi:hypothetical protein
MNAPEIPAEINTMEFCMESFRLGRDSTRKAIAKLWSATKGERLFFRPLPTDKFVFYWGEERMPDIPNVVPPNINDFNLANQICEYWNNMTDDARASESRRCEGERV